MNTKMLKEKPDGRNGLSVSPGSHLLADASFVRCNTNTVHIVLPDDETGEVSKTALCGYTATIEIPFPRYAPNAQWPDGSKIFTGMGAIVRESNEGWKFCAPANGVSRKQCERCRKVWNRLIENSEDRRAR